MREIKFRAMMMHRQVQEDGTEAYLNRYEWFYGGGVWTFNNGYTLLFGEDENGNGYPVVHRVEKDSVGQYTGLRDKNGKDIYEGDILQFEIDGEMFMTSPVEWKPEFGIFGAGINVGEWCPEDMWACEADYEVIGNIYEHPELLR